MEQTTWLTNNFLIAMPNMADPNFTHTVTLICDHSAENGAIGIVINRTLDLTVADALDQMNIATDQIKDPTAPVYDGGPVQVGRGFILHDAPLAWESSIKVSDNLALTASSDILHAIAKNEGPENYLLALGYAGWGPGQLEAEIADNAWLHAPATEDIIFEAPIHQRWNQAAFLMGVDINSMGMQAGHA